MKKTTRESKKEGRIVNVASEAHRFAYPEGIRFDKINDQSSYNNWRAYGQSKLANVLHANQLTKHLKTYAKNHNDTNLLVEVMKLLKRNDLPLQPGTADIVFSICYNTDEWELINKYAKRFVKAGVKLRQTSFETWMGFAAKRVELAEMLSTDMQKEGLHGRTLTLKLKTTSFEVRNRAVTLQNYINSSEDILKHASKLLKAELPVSVRLIGLRVSQFNGDKSGSGATPDRTQKTITNFITSGEANRKKDPFSDVTDHDFISDIETDPSIDVGHTSQLDSRDPFDGNHSLDVNHQSCTLWKNDGAEKVQTSGNDAASSHHSACTEMLGSTSFQGKFEGKNVIGLCFFSQDQKHRIKRQSKSKKQKLSQREGRYTPIDYFFVKE
ncbi:Short-chain dehydrogenase TIC 32 [Lathyrus oleraceus]|uniref:DNA-directed DNA polymerase n=1 Tax=Pisum sativum TaxID=3888 RepID=A0A9D4Y1W4_PEA|nr:Short-chain dehydrogenase TIC 32 [Pisum sativum]